MSRLVGVLTVALAAVTIVAAVNDDLMKGLPGVGVLVEDLNDDAEAGGLTKSTIQTATEIRLRTHGIPVLREHEVYETAGGPTLYVRVSTMMLSNRRSIIYSTEVQLEETVFPERAPKRPVVGATTWKASGFIGIAPPSDLTDAVLARVREQVDQFVNEYLKANPKE